MNKRNEYPEKKDSTILKVILQVISFLLIIAFITLYVTSHDISLNFAVFLHFLGMVILIAGFAVSFENTLYAGLIFLLFCLIIAIAVTYKIFDLTAVVIDTVIGVLILITGILFIATWCISKSQWD
ncbi:hypothetical protein [Maribellus mangrovi]|uniref:hypothetical protein n=1 Tax=Maribellus mangrovi TaxID=3133146 RepID=UPI0030EE4493